MLIHQFNLKSLKMIIINTYKLKNKYRKINLYHCNRLFRKRRECMNKLKIMFNFQFYLVVNKIREVMKREDRKRKHQIQWLKVLNKKYS